MASIEERIPGAQSAWTWRGSAMPGALERGEIAVPKPLRGEVLVRNEIIGLNPVDWKVLTGLPSCSEGHVPGVDGAGIVAAVGDESLRPWIGRRVAYHQSLHKQGSFAKYTPLAARALMQVPDGLGLPLAASLPCPALTAWLSLDKLPIRPGARLLISGAGGAVGNYLVQLALQCGYSVTAMCNARHWDRLRGYGVQSLIAGPIDPGAELPGELMGRYFSVIDTVSGGHAATLVPALEANGHIVCVQDRLPAWPSDPFGRCLSIHEVALGALHVFGSDAAWTRLVNAGETIMRQIVERKLQPEPLLRRDFSALPELLAGLQKRTFSGKPLIKVN
ncbi:zinc-binding dehydrogenase [Rhizobium sp. 18065]|uniref:zinc-binding dehydrogenase n=1 Tax=Rhizobium sp. 18065 TaxID=2681411 RepID=UPI001359137A|nr:zinc-binding dehydrogenase [Rhizobium sp. 18065]